MKIIILNSSDIAYRRIIPALKKVRDIEIVAVCSRDINKAKRYSEDFNIPYYTDNYDSLPEADAVYISSPPSLHYEQIKYFLNKGIHVLSEKSITTDYQHTLDLILLANKNNLILQENYAFEFHAQWKFINDNLETIGHIQYIKSSFEFPPRNVLTDFRYNVNLGGGSLYDAGGYPIKLASLLLSNIKHCMSSSKHSAQYNVDLFGNCYFVDSNGTSAFLSWGFNSLYKCDLEIVGSKGTIKANKIFTPKAEESTNVTINYIDGISLNQTFTDDHFVSLIEDFKHRIKSKDNSHHINIIKQSYWQSYVSINSITTIID